jgi:glutamate dehydrogenase (NAD(P)+)
VTVSYFEWVQNIENEKWAEADVNAKLKAKMEHATDAVLERQKGINDRVGSKGWPGPKEKADLRTAAFALAVDRVAQVAQERGIWP